MVNVPGDILDVGGLSIGKKVERSFKGEPLLKRFLSQLTCGGKTLLLFRPS